MHRIITTFVIGISITLYSYSSMVIADEVARPQKVVLITGASSGIGRKISNTLAAKGYMVYAGARKEVDLKELNNIENM
jgi:NADPH:quinone reductase-like Zn-dependent oxidoreductase